MAEYLVFYRHDEYRRARVEADSPEHAQRIVEATDKGRIIADRFEYAENIDVLATEEYHYGEQAQA